MSNLATMAMSTTVDGLKFLFRHVEHDRMQLEYNRIFDIVQDVTGLPTATLNRLIKFKAVRGEHSAHGSLYSIFLIGDAARVYDKIPWRFAAALTEMHVKCWLVERCEGAGDAFVDAVWHAPTVVNVAPIKSKPKKGKPKGTGQKGVRIGSRKSDKHAVVYPRQGEHHGYEQRLRDAELKKAVAMVELARSSTDKSVHEMTDGESWYMLKTVVSRAGFAYSQKLLREMGINIAEYFSHVSTTPKDGAGQRKFALDFDEELSAIVPLT